MLSLDNRKKTVRERWGETLILNKVIQSIVCSLASVSPPPNSTSDAVTQSDCEHSIMGMTEANTYIST